MAPYVVQILLQLPNQHLIPSRAAPLTVPLLTSVQVVQRTCPPKTQVLATRQACPPRSQTRPRALFTTANLGSCMDVGIVQTLVLHVAERIKIFMDSRAGGRPRSQTR